MVIVRSNPKRKSTAPNMAPKREATGQPPPAASDNSNFNEAALRKLPRAELQNLAKTHKVKANIKSEQIIQQLLRLRPSKKSRPAEDDLEGRSRKRLKNDAVFAGSTRLQNQGEPQTSGPPTNAPSRANVGAPQLPEAGPSGQRPVSPTKRVGLPYDKDLYSGTESEMTEEEQLEYNTPVSSRSGTPAPANVVDLQHCVTVMRQISEQDATLLKEVTEARETAVKLRKRARDVRDLVKSEKGRRERVEAYFRYWQEIQPRWDRKWLYGEKGVPDHMTEPDNLAGPAGLPTAPEAQNMDGERHEKPAMRKPVLSPEELKRRREEIVSKQEAEQRELEELGRNGGFFRFRPSEAAEPRHNLGGGLFRQNLTDPDNIDRPPPEDNGEVISSSVVATSP